MMFADDCCTRSFALGAGVCPVCRVQAREERDELATARAHRTRHDDLKPAARELAVRRAFSAEDLGLSTATDRRMAQRNPARRAVFRLLGFYLPETEARDLLRIIHEFKWIEAEKAGCDIWTIEAPEEPLRKAARDWAGRFLPRFLEAAEREVA